MKDEGYPIKLKHPYHQKGIIEICYSDQFVDDQSHGAVSFGDGIEECTRKLEVHGNLSNILLNASGGGDNFGKIVCYVVQQVPDNGEWRMLKEEENPELQVRIEDLDNGGFRFLQTLNHTKVHKIIGYTLNLTNDNT